MCIQAFNPKESRLIQTFKFVVVQQHTLENIRDNFPQLIGEANIAELEFNKKYGKALSSIFFEVKALITEKQLDFKKYLLKIKELNFKQLTKHEAVLFINKVKNRAKGKLPYHYLKTLKEYENKKESKLLTYKD